MDEGSNWEAMLFAAHHGLDNLVAIVDYNKIQSFGSVKEFRWHVRTINGHDHKQISKSLSNLPAESGHPLLLFNFRFAQVKYSFSYERPFIKIFFIHLVLTTTAFLVVWLAGFPIAYFTGAIITAAATLYSYYELKKRIDFAAIIQRMKRGVT